MVLCLLLILFGAGILAVSIYQYYKTLTFMKSQTYEEKIFNNWIYGASLAMMGFFLVGYICTGVMLLQGDIQHDSFLIAIIYFFGAIFVYAMVNVQKIMSQTITNKTIETIQSLIYSMEAKDHYTKGHSEHVLKLAEIIYENLPEDQKKGINVTKLKDAAILHDIGKIGIPDHILNKPGPLDDKELRIIKQHPENGKVILEKTCYRDVSDWVLYHHERVDGKGYYQIPENAIPIEAKILGVADTFSALFTDRVYRKKFTYEKSIEILKEVAGTQLDEKLVDVFCSIEKEKIIKLSDRP